MVKPEVDKTVKTKLDGSSDLEERRAGRMSTPTKWSPGPRSTDWNRLWDVILKEVLQDTDLSASASGHDDITVADRYVLQSSSTRQ